MENMNMINRRFFHSSIVSLGRPFKNRNSRPVLHAAFRPAEKADIDFSKLGNSLDLIYNLLSLS